MKAKNAQTSLREQAEQQLASAASQSALTPESLLHELQVHQIELEMQNESLRQTRAALEAAYAQSESRYSELYEFAPVAYLTLNQSGQIIEANLTATQLLGVERGELLHQRFARYVSPVELEFWRHAVASATTRAIDSTLSLTLQAADGSIRHVQISCQRMHINSPAPTLRLALTDVSQIRQIESRLRESEEKLCTALDYSPNAIMIVGRNGLFTYSNRQAERLLGYGAAELLQIGIVDTLPPDAIEAATAAFERNLAGSLELFETTLLAKDGSRLTVEIHGVRLPDGNVLGELRDITELKRVQAELAQYQTHLEAMVEQRTQHVSLLHEELGKQQHLLQSIIDHAPAAIFAMDRDGRYLLANQHYAELIGITPESIRARRDEDILPAEDAARRQAMLNEVLSANAPREHEEIQTRADGPHTHLVLHFPLLDEEGKTYAVGGIATDISERIRAQEDIKRSEARLNEAQRIAHLGNWDYDIEHDLLFWSDEIYRLFELDPRTTLPTYEFFLACVHPEDRDKVDHAFRDSVANRRLFETTHRMLMPDGRIKHFFNRGETHYRPDGQPYRSFGTAHDITARLQAEQQLANMQTELEYSMRFHVANQTVAAIAHELNQPLNAISTYSEAALRLLRAGNPQPNQLLHALESNAQQAQRAGKVVRELMQCIKEQEIETEPVNLNEIVISALTRVRAESTSQFQQQLDLEAGLKAVNANRLQLEKVLINLIRNSIEAMRKAGIGASAVKIAIRSDSEGNSAHVSVKDTGPGIDAALQHRIFTPFFSTKPKGLGMGLAISRAIIEAHGGQLWFESEPGEGASFHFQLPFAESA
jgi:two-component system, LuxR family, sensor kinase FixL